MKQLGSNAPLFFRQMTPRAFVENQFKTFAPSQTSWGCRFVSKRHSANFTSCAPGHSTLGAKSNHTLMGPAVFNACAKTLLLIQAGLNDGLLALSSYRQHDS